MDDLARHMAGGAELVALEQEMQLRPGLAPLPEGYGLVQSGPDKRGQRLWRHPEFAKLWAGQTISLFGSSITALALPSVAILTLGAQAYQVGLLQAVQFLAFPLLGLPAGVWVDRLPRKAVMIVADVGRALALGSVPLAWAVHRLTLGQLYLVALVVGVLTVFFDVAYQSYLPALIDRVDLVEGNSKLEISRSASEVAGKGLGGILIQSLGAPLSVLVDALPFIASVAGLAAIRKREAGEFLPRYQEVSGGSCEPVSMSLSRTRSCVT